MSDQTLKLKADFRREVIDKLSVARGGKEPQGLEARIHNQQCEDFLCEQFDAAVDTLTARCEALETQARDISVTLSDAGVNAMPIPEGVRTIVTRCTALGQSATAMAAIIAAQDERISNLCGELAKARSDKD